MGGGLVRSLICKKCLRGGAFTNEFLQIPTQCPIVPQESVVGPVIDRRIRRAVCGCGYAFPSKHRARPDSVLQAMKHEGVHVRASETPVQTVNRKEQDKLRQSSKRASETTEQTMNRQEQNRARMASMRASETPEQTGNRQEQNRLHKVNVRASETPVQTVNRQEQN